MFRMLIDRLRALWRSRSAELRKDFDRSVSFGDLISDRWEKARMLGFGEGASIYDNSLVIGDVKVGENTWIGPNTVLDGSGGGLEIGSYCGIGPGVQIFTHETLDWSLSGGKEPYVHAPTKIGDNCFIGANSVIRMGVTIGDGCVVAPLSFVNRDVPDGVRVGGTPAKPLPVKLSEVELDHSDNSRSAVPIRRM